MSEVEKKQRVNITLSYWMLRELDYMADIRGMSRSAFLSMLIANEFFDQSNEGNIDFDVFNEL